MDRFHLMQIYVQIVERGSFTRVAETMQLHRPTVSKALQQLEQELGVRLLNRSTRKLSVTTEGREFYRHCTQLLSAVEDAFSGFSQSGASPHGRLRLDIAISVAKSLVIPALPKFTEQYPRIHIVFGASDQPIDLVEEGVDCVVRLGELKDSSLIARRVGAIPMVTCAAPAYLDRFGEPKALADLHNHRTVSFFSGKGRRAMDWTFIEQGKELQLKLASEVVTDDSEALLAFALAGMGIIQGVRPAVEPHISSGALVEVLRHIPAAPKPISILYPNRSHLPLRTRVFIEWFTALMHRESSH